MGPLGCAGYLRARRLCSLYPHDGTEEEGPEGLEAEEGTVGWAEMVDSVAEILQTWPRVE